MDVSRIHNQWIVVFSLLRPLHAYIHSFSDQCVTVIVVNLAQLINTYIIYDINIHFYYKSSIITKGLSHTKLIKTCKSTLIGHLAVYYQ